MKKNNVMFILSCLLISSITTGAADSLSEGLFAHKAISEALRSRISLGSRTLMGHTEQVTSVAFDHGGRKVASGSWDTTVRIWNVYEGICSRVLKGHTSGINAVIFNSTGTMIASASWDGTVRIWQVAGGDCLHILSNNTGGVLSVAFSPDGKLIASGSDDGSLTIWDAHVGRCLYRLHCHKKGINSVVFSSDGTKLMTGARDKTACLWRVMARRLIFSMQGSTNWMGTVALSSDGKRFAASRDRKIYMYNFEPLKLQKKLKGHTHYVGQVKFNAQGDELVSSSYDHTLRIWNVLTGDCRAVLVGHKNWVCTAVFNSSGTALASGSHDKTVRIWYDVLTDIQKISNHEELQFLIEAAQDWTAGNAHKVVRNNLIYQKIIACFEYLKDDRLFAVIDDPQEKDPEAEQSLAYASTSSPDNLIYEDDYILPMR